MSRGGGKERRGEGERGGGERGRGGGRNVTLERIKNTGNIKKNEGKKATGTGTSTGTGIILVRYIKYKDFCDLFFFFFLFHCFTLKFKWYNNDFVGTSLSLCGRVPLSPPVFFCYFSYKLAGLVIQN